MRQIPIQYDWASFTLSNGASDYDVATEIAALFSNVPVGHHFTIFHNTAISMKINSTLMPAITLSIAQNPFQTPNDFLEIKNIYLSNASGGNCTIEILLW